MANEIPSKETERETVIQHGECRYCGQMYTFEGLIDMTEEEKMTIATSKCDCEEAIEETQRLDSVNLAKSNAKELLGKYHFLEEFIAFIEPIAQKKLDQVQVKIENVTVTMKLSNNRIKITKKVTDNKTLEA